MINIMMETAQVTCGFSKGPYRHKETWWYNEKAAEAVREKKKKYGNWKKEKSTEAWKEYKKSKQNAKRVIALAKGMKQKECASDINDPDYENEIFRRANQMVKEGQDITGSNCLKGVSGKVIVDEKGIKDSWKQYRYIEKRMNEENERDHRITAGVNEGPTDCIRIDEVAAALKKRKRHNAPGLSGLVTEMIPATGDIGTQWMLNLCNGVVTEGCIPEDWRSCGTSNLQRERGSNGVWILQRN